MARSEGAQITVAVVDDEQNMHVYLSDVLKSSGQFDLVGCYRSGEEALAELPRVRPQVVLMDIRMPGMSGIECTRRLKARIPGVKVIVLTGVREDRLVSESVDAGVDGFLYKPCSLADCQRAIREALEGGSPFSADANRVVVEELLRFHQENQAAKTLTSQERRTLDWV